MPVSVLVIFWFSVAVIAYTYLGYPLLLACLTRRRPEPPERDDPPAVDVVIAAYNEERWIEEKLRNTLALDYPPDKLTITVVTDGSTDATPERVRHMAGERIRLLHQPERQGKGAALARAVPGLHGEIVLFTDANCSLAPGTARRIVHFADPRSAASGAKRLLESGRHGGGEGLYWRYESWLKALMIAWLGDGGPGEVAARAAAYRPPPPDIVLRISTPRSTSWPAAGVWPTSRRRLHRSGPADIRR